MSDPDWQSLLSEQVRVHGAVYFKVAYGIVRGRSAAEDVCQQAFLQAWEDRHAIRPESLRGWLFKTVMNCGLQFIRRGKAEQRAMTARVATLAEADLLDRRETSEWVMAALNHLPERTRHVVVLRTIQEMSGNEVKDLLGMSASDVSRTLHLGLKQLRQILESDRIHTEAEERKGN